MNVKDSRKAALARAIESVGGQSELARKLGVGQNRVNNWLNRDRQGTPAEFCARIEALTEGDVSCHELRPDVFPAPAKQQVA